MASQDRPAIESDDWKERFNALWHRATIGAEPVETVAKPVSKPVTTPPSPDVKGEAPQARSGGEADAWKAGWWALSNDGSVAEGRERIAGSNTDTAPVKTRYDIGAKQRAAAKAEHERIYQFFQKRYGGDNTSLPAWQKLCQDAEVEIGTTIRMCKEYLNQIYAYIFPFVKAVETGGKVEKLATYEDLRARVKARPFPLEEAKENEFLQVVLKHIWTPERNWSSEQRQGHAAGAGGPRPQTRGHVSRQAPRRNDMSSIDARIAAIRARKAAAKDGSNGKCE
ncbi:hypothetical protein B0A48_10857 [Cryoendolithus antarcticus]|uniref:Uncharacterized protein n=1 Tax=Cryoendolithus antarcticus TaxID=1507870 RepID=A0A1V8SYK1_9PEZI|nr:hypothetical protein B0A48_10857 [Cryoendolithus antarcticus]